MSKKKSHISQNRLLLGNLVKTFIGSQRSIKCVDDEGSRRYFKHASVLLEHLDVEHPVYQYVISVSQEFRKQFGAGAADDLLYYIHSWSRLASYLNEMGIPMENVMYHMKAVINECIQHIETKKIKVTEVGKNFDMNKAELCNFDDFGTCVEDKSRSSLNHFQKDEDVKKDPTIETLSDVECDQEVNSGAVEIDNDNDNVAENDSRILHHIQEIICDHDTCNNKENPESCMPNAASSVNEDGIEFIHLEMKNVKSEKEDFNDTAWFFDDVEALKENDIEKLESTICDQTENTEDDRNRSDKDVVICDALKDAEDSDDSGAIVADIENLKRDIENDLKRLKNNKERWKQVNVHKDLADSTKTSDQNHFDIDEEFDSCFVYSDSEFNDCFEEKLSDKWTTSVKEEHKESKTVVENEKFKTVEFKLTNITLKENMKRKSSDSSQKPSPDIPSKNIEHCLNSKVDAATANKGSFAIEIEKCHKEYSKTKEILGIAVNREAVRKVDQKFNENIKSYNCGKETKEFNSVSRNEGQTVSCEEDLKTGTLAKPVGPIKSDCIESQKFGYSLPHVGQIQQINSLLGSLGKASKMDASKTNVSALKFRSRHFQDGENEKSDGNNKSIPKINHGGHSGRNESKLNEETDSFPGYENNVIGEGLLYLDQSSDTNQDLSDSVHPFTSETNRKSNSVAEKQLGTLNLESINSMLRDTDGIHIWNRNMKYRGENLQTLVCHTKERNADCREMSETSSSMSSKPGVDTSDIKIEKIKLDISNSKNSLSSTNFKKDVKIGSVKHSRVFLRSRHMNTEEEVSENSEVLETSGIINSLDQEIQSTENLKTKQFANTNDFADTRNQLSENKSLFEEVKAEVRNLVWRVNFDGDEHIKRAVYDVVLKQYGEGNTRLNIDLVECYTRFGAHSGPLEVIDGVVVQTSVETMMTLQKIHGKHCRALLVNADLTMTFRHKGYKPLKAREFSSLERFTCGESKLDSWQEDIIDVLKMLCIDVLLVKGSISDNVRSICEQHDIVVMDTIPYKQLAQLSEAAHVDMVTYVTLATEDNVCTGISVSPLQENWCNEVDRSWHSKVDTVISFAENNPQTVILYGVSHVLIDLKEQELWNCLDHVSSVLHYGYLIPGAGKTEEACARFPSERSELLRRDQKSETSCELQYKQIVMDSVMSSFQDYSRLFKDSCLEAGYALEGYKSKIETWKLAIDTVTTVTNFDSYIVTGITEENVDLGTL